MAELSVSRNSRAVPKVDLTAMVDLAFLLITFFMLTTSLSKPVAMDVAKPDDGGVQEAWPASRTMTILLGKNDKIAWYVGEPGKVKPDITNFNQIRKSIIESMQKVALANHNDNRKPLFIIIKPTSGSSYKNFVDIMDELSLAGIKAAPAIDDDHILDEEKSFMNRHGL
ncbi:biopolymer transporter ExbD [Pedobacter sp. JY14-1]|uniref:ExbD/TolR family protein n=1 Tax=Pedobacter sp. JY14-1 TaxID=3034151 RepID=UPI0023E1A43B|nr:biopolymer transporter ExbD [Pedobacter sp. JY14-1]